MIPVNHLMTGALASILRHAPLTPEKVAFSWRTAVGPAVDKVTAVELHDGVLYVRARDAAWQREVERSAALIRSRLDGLLGAANRPEGSAAMADAVRTRNAELCDRIRRGESDEAEVFEHVRRTVADKLRVSDPGLLERSNADASSG